MRLLLFCRSIPAFLKALGPGERWITVRAPGHDKGQPLLVRDEPNGSVKVIGGAGGKLNHLKLNAVKPESSYKDQVAEKRKDKQEVRKQQQKRDKELGLAGAKKSARDDVQQQRRIAEREYIKTVGDAMGWKAEDLQADIPENISDTAKKRLEAQHHGALLRKAHDAVDLQRQRLLADAEARQNAGIGVVPLDSSDPSVLSVADLSPSAPVDSSGLGYSTDYKKRAADAGLSDEALQEEVSASRQSKQAVMTPAQRDAAIKRGDTARMVRAEIEALREPISGEVKATLVDAKQAVELLKAQKKLRVLQKSAAAANKDIDASTESKAYNLDAADSSDLDAKVKEDLENDLRTIRTRAFLSQVENTVGSNASETLGKHIGVGAYNSINSLALSAGGAALVDRSVVDVLGIAGAAQVLARRLHADLDKEDVARVTEGMEDFHLHHYMETSTEAMSEAQSLMDAAKEISLGVGQNADDLAAAQELNGKRRDAIAEAHKILGQSLGEMEANAALVVAMKQGRADKPLEVPLGELSMEAAVRQVRAIGLQRGDYRIDSVGGNRILTVKPEGLDRLAAPVDREDLARVRRNLDIIEGKHDEQGWLPKGVADRPDLVMNAKPGVVPQLAEPFEPSGNPEELPGQLRDYIGGRAADGDTPADILADIQSADFFTRAGDTDAYRAALDAVAPLKGDDGMTRTPEHLGELFDEYADAFAQKRHGGAISPLNRQKFNVDQTSVDALHRALSEEPAGVMAYKPVGELTNQDQRALREFFHAHIAKESDHESALRHELDQHEARQPEPQTTDASGKSVDNPQHQEWKARRDELAGQANAASLNWEKYANAMHGPVNAYAALQDMIRSRVSSAFAKNHNTLNPTAPIKVGRAVIRNNLNHLDAVDPAALEARMSKESKSFDTLRGPGEGKTLAADERHTVGHAAERQIAGMMDIVGKNFKPGQQVKLWRPSMDGDGIARQRAIKLIEANKRVALAAGVGSGKSLMMMSAYTHLQQQGKAKRGLFLVPSIVQDQFSGEALRYLEPGKFNWHIQPGASREERIKAYKNPEHHFAVMTHQSFRDDMLHLGASHADITPEEMSARLQGMQPAERKAWMRDVMDREGIHFDFSSIDEGHNLLNRAGKENSGMANVIDAFTSNMEYHVAASADPIKNDASEAFDLLAKMEPERYTDRAAFMRRYGVDTQASKDALRRELARYVYPSKIVPKVRADKTEINVKLGDAQRQAIASIEKHASSARLSRMAGKVDVEAMKSLAPSMFEGQPEEKHEAIARNLQGSVGILKASAMRRVIDAHPESAKLDEIVKTAAARKGKQGVVFAHSLDAVEAIRARLEKEGHKVAVLTGKDSSTEKGSKLRKFENGGADIVVASDAGATGANMQSGQWLVEYDTPDTAMTHAQRQGRIYRTGQKNDVELIDLVADHPAEHRARVRLKNKYALRELMTSPLDGLDDSGLAYYLKQRGMPQENAP